MTALNLRTRRIAAACVVAAAIGLEVWALQGPGDTPADAVRSYFQAALAKDCPTAFDLLTEPIRGTYGTVDQLCDRARADKLVAFQLGDEQAAGTTATVTVTLVRPNLTLTDRVHLTTVDGTWRISSFEVVQSEHGHGHH
ncbi:hypothetical protein [Labedaea rhizosphaerae]|uniref:DUF4878 domain-containing protein n=1 Tax=Labedaea rhizosphaerae TaxID=598644 RepID=A0A4R6SFL1_LABRH|nr:hypothetical protein [Labedaea rhizosphaerae]TDQ00277.1 hypothetical protein EV186_102138 [Labedaea rhizosphaerae]